MPHPLGLELLTVLGLGPVEHVTLAADLGCTAVSMGLTQLPERFNPHGYPAWSLRDDAGLRRDLKAVLRDRGVAISIAEGLGVSPDIDASQREADMDLFADLGARRVNSVDMGAERARAFDQLAMLAEMAAERGMGFSIEFCPLFTIRSLPEALDAVRHIGEGRAGVLIDAMHFFRSGGTVRQIAELDPALIGHVQISDAPRKGEGDYMAEAMTGRMVPGQGELPLREFVDALPRGQVLGLEVPLMATAQNGRVARDYVGEIVKRTREFLV
ncbi:sugar phosphate isomerase/epimerase [Novosphingobium sp. P6W]|jgi:sugar phosphate isomerase/epimerase|uniref:sugar phosphate isomerase/epimerase family protein n=1 Tax=Novosphingobium sp. P6W TaxID=1609758 RepID=UPI0005C2E9FE|nr:sugar phosphate isomerase/epimerase [Novosphingobium sp. P6W]AXB77570.1 sugar phosphate isomerase/epimerase [Novosphingobium sp. P6W]KIS33932.1 sugar phosphate isomerase [Novosphingobium sp. P6W]